MEHLLFARVHVCAGVGACLRVFVISTLESPCVFGCLKNIKMKEVILLYVDPCSIILAPWRNELLSAVQPVKWEYM